MWIGRHLLLGFQTSSAAVDISISPCLLPAIVNDQEARRDIACLQTFESLLDACSMGEAQMSGRGLPDSIALHQRTQQR